MVLSFNLFIQSLELCREPTKNQLSETIRSYRPGAPCLGPPEQNTIYIHPCKSAQPYHQLWPIGWRQNWYMLPLMKSWEPLLPLLSRLKPRHNLPYTADTHIRNRGRVLTKSWKMRPWLNGQEVKVDSESYKNGGYHRIAKESTKSPKVGDKP